MMKILNPDFFEGSQHFDMDLNTSELIERYINHCKIISKGTQCDI